MNTRNAGGNQTQWGEKITLHVLDNIGQTIYIEQQ